jgi:hypothetical protein
VWAALQTAEVQAIALPEFGALRLSLDEQNERRRLADGGTTCRPSFEQRGGQHKSLFDDPWFDGSNFECTIVATPNRGTLIAPTGQEASLVDDAVASIAQRELEWGGFHLPADVVDFPALFSQRFDTMRESELNDLSGAFAPSKPGHFRFVRLGLHSGIEIAGRAFAEQLGHVLWTAVGAGDFRGLPSGFEERNLLNMGSVVVVWSQHGIGMVHEASARSRADDLRARLQDLAEIARHVTELVTSPPPAKEALERGERLLARIAALKLHLGTPEGWAMRRFFESLSLDEATHSVRDLIQRQQQSEQTSSIERNMHTVASVQVKVEWIEILIITFYAAHLTHMLSETIWPDAHAIIVALTASVSLGAGTLATLTLQPWTHDRSKRIWLAPIALCLTLIGWLSYGLWQFYLHR